MKSIAMVLGLLLAFIAVAPVTAKEKGDSTKTLTGKVMDRQDHVLTDAVVYLSNKRTQAVKTYIVGPDGTYRFPALAPSIDYEVYAQYKGQKSETKAVSQFDDHQQVTIVLRIDVK
jgi:hypothetical protein